MSIKRLSDVNSQLEGLLSSCGGNVKATGLTLVERLNSALTDIEDSGLESIELVNRKLGRILRHVERSVASVPTERNPVNTCEDQPVPPTRKRKLGLPDKCDCFDLTVDHPPLPKRGVRYIKAMEATDSSLDLDEVVSWLTDGTLWAHDKTEKGKMGYVITASCRFGTRTRKYLASLEKGVKACENPRSRGLAKQDAEFNLCNCRVRVHVSPTHFVGPVFVSVDQGNDGVWRTHTHGPSDSGFCNAAIASLDPSLYIHNAVVRAASADPVSSTNRIIAKVGHDIIASKPEQFSAWMNKLNASKDEIRRLVCSVRSYTRKPLTVRDLETLRDHLDEEYFKQVTTCYSLAQHLPRIIGITVKGDDDMEKLEELAITFSTNTLLRRAARCRTLLVDATFKVTTAGFPLIACGTSDSVHGFRLISVSLVLGETTKSYSRVFEHLMHKVREVTGIPFNPECVMADAASSITSSMRKFSRLPTRLVCYFHVKQAIRKYFKYTARMEDENSLIGRFLRDVDILSHSFSVGRFEYILQLIKQKYGIHSKIIRYLDRKDGFFDTTGNYYRWFWIPDRIESAWDPTTNNAVESFNNKIKTDLLSKKIKPLQQVIFFLSEDLLSSYSADNDDEVLNKQSYRSNAQILKAASATGVFAQLLEKFHFILGTWDGTTYAVADHDISESDLKKKGMDMFNNHDNPLTNKENVYLTFIPDDANLLDANPGQGGPICSCSEYRKGNSCKHILALFISTGKFRIEHELRIGQSTRANGRTKPKETRPALVRLT